MLRIFDAANAISLVALLAAAACCALAIRGFPAYAVIALIVAGICDLFDGLVARRLVRTEEQRLFGGRLDSLVDACAFGFAPIVFLFATGLNSPLDLALLGLFLICAVWRLAYFDTVGLESDGTTRYYIGLPTTYVALILPLVFLSIFAGRTWFENALRAATLMLALAMVSSVRIRKPGGIAYAGFSMLAATVIAVLLWAAPRLHATIWK